MGIEILEIYIIIGFVLGINNGFLLQFGSYLSINMVTPVSLPTSFTNINYVVFGFPDDMDNNNNAGGYGHVRNKTITTMDMRMMDGYGSPPKSQKIDWVCCGY